MDSNMRFQSDIFSGRGGSRISVYSQPLNKNGGPQGSATLMGMLTKKTNPPSATFTESDQVFESAAEIFRVMSAPLRLKIISSLCNGEKNVSQLLQEIVTTQPNMSQHLNMLYQNGIIGKRRDGVQIFYRIINDRVVTLCRAVCTQIAIETDYGNDR